MDAIYNLNPAASALNFQDSIDERLIKAKAVTACLLLLDNCDNEPSNSVLFDAIWAVDDYLEKILECQEILSKLKRENRNEQK